MTKAQYLAALKRLGLTPAGQETSRRLGLTLRQCQNYAAGDCPIPKPVALLLEMYQNHGLPEETAS